MWLRVLSLQSVGLQPSDADVVARPAEDGGGEQEGPGEHELHQVAQQSGRPADRVSVLHKHHV